MRGDYFPDDDGFVKLVRHEPLGWVLVLLGWILSAKLNTNK